MSALAQDAVEVTIWGNHPEWKDPMQEILDAFQAAVPGVEVELTEIPGPDYGAQDPDRHHRRPALRHPRHSGGRHHLQWLPAGDLPFIDLTGKVDVSGLTDSARSQVEVDGKVYGCPLAAYTVGLAINNPVFAEHGVTPPTTWDELRAAAQALKEAGETPTRARRQGLGPPLLHVHRPRLVGPRLRRLPGAPRQASAS